MLGTNQTVQLIFSPRISRSRPALQEASANATRAEPAEKPDPSLSPLFSGNESDVGGVGDEADSETKVPVPVVETIVRQAVCKGSPLSPLFGSEDEEDGVEDEENERAAYSVSLPIIKSAQRSSTHPVTSR
jgi:uncharacterized membrane-anchored protein